MATDSSQDFFKCFEQPLWFEGPTRTPLYGVFYRAKDRVRRELVGIFCHSIGLDQLVTSRIEVLAARALAARGFSSFSYHARGHGDSAGNFADVTFDSLVEDALSAAEQARRLAEGSGIVWIGTRFGGLIAAAAMGQRQDTAGLALWEPVHRGADYFRALMRRRLFLEVANERRPNATVANMVERLARDGEIPLIAEWLHRPLYQSAMNVDLAENLKQWRGPTMLAQIQSRKTWSADNAALIESLRNAGALVAAVTIVDQPSWENPSEPWWTSPQLIEKTVEWFHGMA